MDLEGKFVLVTGGSAGIGKAIALRLGREGADVAICGRSIKRLQQAQEQLKTVGLAVSLFRCDVGQLEQVVEMVEALTAETGQIDILVNNAGALEDTPLESPNDEGWDQVVRTNLDGVYYVTSRVVPYMPEGGRIINISSVLGKMGVPGAAAYCASKHAVIGFTRSIALELSEKKITANVICPGWVNTDLARIVMERAAGNMGISYEEFFQNAMEQVPLGEMIQPEEIASLVHFLVSPSGGKITGQSYSICGGQVMH
jgi:NAD(P)-dependent dehydrogenase (short-subunit alcohol dehydrogenase family)